MPYDEKLAERMRSKVNSTAGLIEKKMFGGVGFLIDGNMACGIVKQDMVVRLSDRDFEAALKKPYVRIFDMTGRPMKGWVLVAPQGLTTERALEGWIQKGISYAGSLPPK